MYLRFRPIPMYFSYRTFDFDVSEISISFPFPKLPFPISFPIKNMKTVMVLVFSDRFRPFSPLSTIRLLGRTLESLALSTMKTDEEDIHNSQVAHMLPCWKVHYKLQSTAGMHECVREGSTGTLCSPVVDEDKSLANHEHDMWNERHKNNS